MLPYPVLWYVEFDISITLSKIPLNFIIGFIATDQECRKNKVPFSFLQLPTVLVFLSWY